MKTTPGVYTGAGLIRLAVGELPTRGAICPKCGICILQFVDLTEEVEALAQTDP